MKDLFNSREIAIIIWTFIFLISVVVILFKKKDKDVWHAFVHLIQALCSYKLGIPTVIMLLYIICELYLFHKIGLYSLSIIQVKSAIVWILLYAIPETWGTINLKDNVIFFAKIKIKKLIEFAVVIDFFMNSYSFSLLVELVIQPIITIFILMLTYIQSNKWQYGNKYDNSENIVTKILIFFNFFIIMYVLWQIYHNPSYQMVIDFCTPIVLGIGLIPFAFGLNKYCIYETNQIKKSFKKPS